MQALTLQMSGAGAAQKTAAGDANAASSRATP